MCVCERRWGRTRPAPSSSVRNMDCFALDAMKPLIFFPYTRASVLSTRASVLSTPPRPPWGARRPARARLRARRGGGARRTGFADSKLFHELARPVCAQTGPPHQHIITGPPHQHISTGPPHQHISTSSGDSSQLRARVCSCAGPPRDGGRARRARGHLFGLVLFEAEVALERVHLV